MSSHFKYRFYLRAVKSDNNENCMRECTQTYSYTHKHYGGFAKLQVINFHLEVNECLLTMTHLKDGLITQP